MNGEDISRSVLRGFQSEIKFLKGKRMKLPWIAIFAICVISCAEKQKEEGTFDKGQIGKYLYMSKSGLLHSRKTCIGLQREKDHDGHDVNGIDFVDTALICPNFKFYYCKKCFTDEQYEHVEQIIERNRLMNELADTASVENLEQ